MRARLSDAGEDGGGDDIFDSFLNNTAHGAGTHFGIVASFDKDLFSFGADVDGDFLWCESFVGRCNHEIKNLD